MAVIANSLRAMPESTATVSSNVEGEALEDEVLRERNPEGVNW